jgi:hypothetical protein
MGPKGFPETSVRNYHSMLCNFPEERRGSSASTAEVRNELVFRKSMVEKKEGGETTNSENG